ncbi:MAG: sterol desaturase family protein [Pseudomonadota bacterium]
MAATPARPAANARTNWFLFEACRFINCRIAAAIWLGLPAVILPLALVFGGFAPWLVVGAFLLGLATWSPVEYILHRWIMHWQPANPRLHFWVEKLFPHDGHHLRPDDPGTVRRQQYPLCMMLVVFLVASIVVPMALTAPFFAGIGVGYLLYELVHFAIHQCPMAGPIGAKLKRNHYFHHFRDDTRNFGLTSPLWDWIVGTHFLQARPDRTGEGRA